LWLSGYPSSLEKNDVIARVGGDEFIILQTDERQPEAAEKLARTIIDIVGRTYLVRGHSVQIGASVGIALIGSNGTDPEQFIKQADLALLNAKTCGRGTFRFFADAMDREIQTRRSLEIDLRRALAMQEFSLAYQPQFEIEGRRLVGFEALIRWSTPARGQVSPADFIPLAEEIGLIGPLGDWVLRTACKQAASWPDPLSVSVNLSPLQFKSPKLAETIASALASAGLAPHRLDLEITEGALMDDTDTVVSILKLIKAMGVKVRSMTSGRATRHSAISKSFPSIRSRLISRSFVAWRVVLTALRSFEQ